MTTGVLLAAALAASSPARAAEALLPDLIAWKAAGAFMYDAQVVIRDGRRRLQFSSAFANVGRGPFELRAEVRADGTTTAYQRVYNDDGTYTETLVGTFVFEGHGDHNHFHFAQFAAYRLRTVASGGGLGAQVAASRKVGFAMWDVSEYDLRMPGAPQRAVYERPAGQEDLKQGISVGWADIYGRDLWDQDIDVTGLADGEYWLENEMDPERRLRDADPGNNVARIRIRLEGLQVAFLPEGGGGQPGPPPPQKIVGPSPLPSPNPWRADRHAGKPMSVPVGSGGVLKIFTVTGRHLRSLPSSGGLASWDLTDSSGFRVGSGYYLYAIEEPGAPQRRGKFVIVR